MDCSEIDSFIGKYKFLINAGIKASLKINNLDGEIHVALEANLGALNEQSLSPTRSWFPGLRRGPSYERRQIRRRREVSDNAVNKSEFSSETPIEAAVQAAGLVDTTGNQEGAGKSAQGIDEANLCESKSAESRSQSTEEVLHKDHVKVKKDQDLPANFDAVVQATVYIDNSPSKQIEKDTYKSIFSIIDSKDHMKKNVGRVRVENVINHPLDNGKHRHEASFIFFVDSSRLWETLNAYLWKHFGNSEWTL